MKFVLLNKMEVVKILGVVQILIIIIFAIYKEINAPMDVIMENIF